MTAAPENEVPDGTLYLDVDGTLIFDHTRRDEAGDHPNKDLEFKLFEGHDYAFEAYHPELMSELATTALRTILVSSRSGGFLQPPYEGIVEVLDLDGVIGVDPFNSDADSKLREIIAHHTGQTPLAVTREGKSPHSTGNRGVWIDDSAAHLSEEGQQLLAQHPEILAIAPHPRIGVTREQIQQARDFLAHTPSADEEQKSP